MSQEGPWTVGEQHCNAVYRLGLGQADLIVQWISQALHSTNCVHSMLF